MGGIMPHYVGGVTTFPDLMARRLAADPGQPFVTFYDDATGERTELSVKTFSNWVSKTANLLTDELMLDPGDEVRIALPPHWLGPVFLGAVWSCGLVLSADAEVAVVGPGGLDSSSRVTVACSMHPFATRFAEPLPPGILDHGVLWPGQSDVFVPVAPADLGPVVPDDRRVVTDVDPLSDPGRALLVGLLAGGGSMVLVAHPGEGRWPDRYESERATGTLRTGQPSS
jgi:uncharacterized protein (TIGR03089 family)